MMPMDIAFLGGATTVTGSQFLVTTDRARVLVDCGMFQGSPNEWMRNRIPFGFDPADLTQWAETAGLLCTHSQYLAQKNGFRIQVQCYRLPAD